MRRMTLCAAFAVLLSLPVWAQMRGGGFAGAHGGGGMHGAGMTARSGGRGGGSFGHGGAGHGEHGHSGRSHGGFGFHHHHFSRAGFGYWGYPWAYAYYPGWGWDYPLDYSDYDQSYNQNQQLQAYQLQMMNNQQQIEQRIDSLEDRLDQLYEQRSAPAPEAQPQANRQPLGQGESSQPAVLVYKDGHKQEVQNYAIVGQTIWVLNEQQAKKVPLSALDLNATHKANEERDVQFDIPGSSS